MFLAVIWEWIECNEDFPERWRYIDQCICYCCRNCRRCRWSKKIEPHAFDRNVNSVSDVVVTCLTYSLSWIVWLLKDTLGTKHMWGLLIASPVFCVLMAIVQAAGCPHCLIVAKGFVIAVVAAVMTVTMTSMWEQGCRYVHVQVRL